MVVGQDNRSLGICVLRSRKLEATIGEYVKPHKGI
jgi:hypothetical protein